MILYGYNNKREYLESANLIYQSWPVDMADKKVLKARPKIYIADAAIRNAVLMDDNLMTDSTEMGKVAETAVYKHIAAFYYQKATSVGYFRGGKRNKEKGSHNCRCDPVFAKQLRVERLLLKK